jgi:hypothetical protein
MTRGLPLSEGESEILNAGGGGAFVLATALIG